MRSDPIISSKPRASEAAIKLSERASLSIAIMMRSMRQWLASMTDQATQLLT